MMRFRDIDFSYLIPCIDGFRTVTIESNNYPKWKDLACYDQNTYKKLIFFQKIENKILINCLPCFYCPTANITSISRPSPPI